MRAFPRLVSIKNAAIPVVADAWAGRSGPALTGTPKGTIRHFVPDAAALAAMDTPARPALILFPTFGPARAVREMPASETFVRLTQASTNYVALAEAGFGALTGLVRAVPARAIDYPDTASARALVDAVCGTNSRERGAAGRGVARSRVGRAARRRRAGPIC